MAKLETASILLALGGDQGNTVPKYGVTPAELMVLRQLHGEDAITEIKVLDEVSEVTNRQEVGRLREIYARREGDNTVAREVDMLFPGIGAHVPSKFSELELPDELYAVKERDVPREKDDDATPAADGDKPLDKMTKTELEAYASKYSDLDLAGVTKKDDIRAAIELHEEKLSRNDQDVKADPNPPATGGSVFE